MIAELLSEFCKRANERCNDGNEFAPSFIKRVELLESQLTQCETANTDFQAENQELQSQLKERDDKLELYEHEDGCGYPSQATDEEKGISKDLQSQLKEREKTIKEELIKYDIWLFKMTSRKSIDSVNEFLTSKTK